MSGHSKFANIKHKKNLNDQKKAKSFVKIAKEITTALQKGGANLKNNKALQNAISKAKSLNMPKSHYLNLIKNFDSKTNQSQDLTLYSAFNPFKCAFLIWTLKTNKNRVVANLKSYFEKHNGSLVNKNVVLNFFNFYGCLKFKTSLSENQILEIVFNYDIIDFKNQQSFFIITYLPENKEMIKEMISKNKSKIEVIENIISYFPKNKLILTKEQKLKIAKITNLLDNDEDVVKYYQNF